MLLYDNAAVKMLCDTIANSHVTQLTLGQPAYVRYGQFNDICQLLASGKIELLRYHIGKSRDLGNSKDAIIKSTGDNARPFEMVDWFIRRVAMLNTSKKIEGLIYNIHLPFDLTESLRISSRFHRIAELVHDAKGDGIVGMVRYIETLVQSKQISYLDVAYANMYYKDPWRARLIAEKNIPDLSAYDDDLQKAISVYTIAYSPAASSLSEQTTVRSQIVKRRAVLIEIASFLSSREVCEILNDRTADLGCAKAYLQMEEKLYERSYIKLVGLAMDKICESVMDNIKNKKMLPMKCLLSLN